MFHFIKHKNLRYCSKQYIKIYKNMSLIDKIPTPKEIMQYLD